MVIYPVLLWTSVPHTQLPSDSECGACSVSGQSWRHCGFRPRRVDSQQDREVEAKVPCDGPPAHTLYIPMMTWPVDDFQQCSSLSSYTPSAAHQETSGISHASSSRFQCSSWLDVPTSTLSCLTPAPSLCTLVLGNCSCPSVEPDCALRLLSSWLWTFSGGFAFPSLFL